MQTTTSYLPSLLLLLLCTVVLGLLNISLGSVSIPVSEVLAALGGAQTTQEQWSYIILQYRLPKALTAILAGSGLAVSGMLMQTLFRNPLAGPYVLGLSSGASLGVALVLLSSGLFAGMASTAFFSSWGVVLASSAGSLLVLLAVLVVASRLKDHMAILIVGLMFASLASAVVGILSYFSPAAQLQQYVFWSFGSLGDLSWRQLGVLLLFCTSGLALAWSSSKNLNALLLGEQYARSLGMHVRRNRVLVILATSLLAGSITAFAGPIAFVGLAVPHLIRQVYPTSDHRVLLPAVILGGAILMLACDILAQLPGTGYILPINAITSLVGAPVVIWLLLRKRTFNF